MLRNNGSDPLLFAWPSAGQRESLLFSIEGCVRNLQNHGRNDALFISLDGIQADLKPEISRGLENLSKQYPKQLQIADLNTRLQLLEKFPVNIDRKSASYALLPQIENGKPIRGPGYNRNMIFLFAAGGFLVSTDDDIVFTPATHTNKQSKTYFSTSVFPIPLLYCTDRTSLLSEVKKTSCNIAEQHLQFLRQQELETQSPILLTCAGCYGDSGFGRARTVLTLSGSEREYILLAGYEYTRYSREVIRIPQTNLIGPSMHFMAGHSGYDVGEYLPPFFPFSGNEDGFFAMLVRVCNPDSLTAYPSFGLLHNPPEQRAFTHESLVGFKPSITDLLMALTLSCMPDSSLTDSRSRMIQLGYNYIEKSFLSTVDFVSTLHQCWIKGAIAYAQTLEELLDTYERQPLLWANDVEELLENIYIKIREPLLLFGPTGCGLTVEQVMGHLRKYGNLLTIWPDMLDFAAQKNSSR